MELRTSLNDDLGDFQTPPELVTAVLDCLYRDGKSWDRILEPTCGAGHFISGLVRHHNPPTEIIGLELQHGYASQAAQLTAADSGIAVSVRQANVFSLHLGRDLTWQTSGPLLVVGNPPWITNSELSALGSGNLPMKRNLKGLRGLDARTGSANFDIAEYIWLKLIEELQGETPTIALLCKTSVARNVIQFASSSGLPIRHASLHRIDASRSFGVSADACLFRVDIGEPLMRYLVPVYPNLSATMPQTTIRAEKGTLIADAESYRRASFADGRCPLEWRQGLKHDASSVMELNRDAGGHLFNKHGDCVDVEPDYIFPLLKSSDLFRGDVPNSGRAVIVPQRNLKEDASILRDVAPRLWTYLSSHIAAFERRKSSIYRSDSPFSIFGVGDYSFAPFKVAVSGLHKEPRFRAFGMVENRPVMLDDTCYFIPCASARQAAVIASVLNSDISRDLLNGITFWDAKRPLTKKVLQRIDLVQVARHAKRGELLAAASEQLASMPLAKLSACIDWPERWEDIIYDEAGSDQAVRSASTAGLAYQTRMMERARSIRHETRRPHTSSEGDLSWRFT